MPLERRKYIQTINYMIKVLHRWLGQLEDKPKSKKTIELMEEFEEEGILEVLSDLILD